MRYWQLLMVKKEIVMTSKYDDVVIEEDTIILFQPQQNLVNMMSCTKNGFGMGSQPKA